MLPTTYFIVKKSHQDITRFEFQKIQVYISIYALKNYIFLVRVENTYKDDDGVCTQERAPLGTRNYVCLLSCMNLLLLLKRGL